jgi:hypothetical protein
MSDPTNTDANTTNTTAQTTPDAGGTPLASDAAVVTLPDGSAPPVGDDGLPVVTAADDEPVQVRNTRRRLGASDGTAAPYGLMAKRAARRRGTVVSAEAVAAEPVEDGGYDPADHTVTEVQAYLAENPDQSGYVLDRERGGKARVTLIGA